MQSASPAVQSESPNFDEACFANVVNARMSGDTNPRLREVMSDLVRVVEDQVSDITENTVQHAKRQETNSHV